MDKNERNILIDARKKIGDIPVGLYVAHGKTIIERLIEQCMTLNPVEVTVFTNGEDYSKVKREADRFKVARVVTEYDDLAKLEGSLKTHIIYDLKKDGSDNVVFERKWEINDKKDVEYATTEIGKDELYPCARHYIRPLAQRLAVILSKKNITANNVTYFGTGIGLLTALMIFSPNRIFNILAGVFIILWTYFDHVDGYLARLTKSQSKLGEYLDSELGSMGLNLLFIAIGLGAWVFRGDTNALLWLIGFLFGNYMFFHSINTRSKIKKDLMNDGDFVTNNQANSNNPQVRLIKKIFGFFDDVDIRIHLFALSLVLGIHYQFLIFQVLYFNLRWVSNLAYEFVRQEGR